MERTSQSVKCVKTLVHTEGARVAEFVMGPKSKGEAHYHSKACERCICLKGQIEVKINGSTSRSLKPGGSVEIPAGVGHQVINPSYLVCQYMVVQFGGVYDFIAGRVAP